MPIPLSRYVGFRLAVNLFDLDHIDSTTRALMVGDKLDLSKVIKVNDRLSDTIVAFKCDILTASCVCDILRSEVRKSLDPVIRVYVESNGSWSKIRDNAVLAIPTEGVFRLNSEVFPLEIDLAESSPLEPEKI